MNLNVQFVVSHDSNVQHMKHVQLKLCNCTCFKFCPFHVFVSHKSENQTKDTISHVNQTYRYTTVRVFVLRIRVSCAFPTHCTCVEFTLRMKRESTYFETHEYSLAAL